MAKGRKGDWERPARVFPKPGRVCEGGWEWAVRSM